MAEIAKTHRWNANERHDTWVGALFSGQRLSHTSTNVLKVVASGFLFFSSREEQTTNSKKKKGSCSRDVVVLHRHPSFVFSSYQLWAFMCLERCRLAAAHREWRSIRRAAQLWRRCGAVHVTKMGDNLSHAKIISRVRPNICPSSRRASVRSR